MQNPDEKKETAPNQNGSSSNTSNSMSRIIQRLRDQLPRGISSSSENGSSPAFQRFLAFLFLLNNAFAQETTNQAIGNTTDSSTSISNTHISKPIFEAAFWRVILISFFLLCVLAGACGACMGFRDRKRRASRVRDFELSAESSPVDYEVVDLEAASENHDEHEKNVESAESKEKSPASPPPKTFEERYEVVKDVATKAEKEQAEGYRDPYTQEIIKEPVSLIPCGHVADETSVLNALKRNGDGMECPIGREKVGEAGGFKYVPNKALRAEIERFIEMLEQRKLEQSKTMLEEESVEEKDSDYSGKEEEIAETKPLIGPGNS